MPDISFDIRTICDHMENNVKSASVRQSWKNIRNEFYRMDSELRRLRQPTVLSEEAEKEAP